MTNGRRGAGARVAPPRDELGAHMSIAGGLHRALERGAELACGSVQIFLKNQRQWAAKPMADEDVRAFAAARRATRTAAVFAHASYLIHLGSHMGRGVELGLARVTSALDEATRRTAGYRIRIALENTAGAGNALGRTFGELGELMRRAARPERLGICIDTCHLFAAGYDLRRATAWEAAVEECSKSVGLSRVLAFHLNDARAPLGSGLDRHEHIGVGFLGLGAFRCLLNDRRFARVPKVLETPKEPEPEADRRNLARLRGLRRTPRSRARAGPAGRLSGTT